MGSFGGCQTQIWLSFNSFLNGFLKRGKSRSCVVVFLCVCGLCCLFFAIVISFITCNTNCSMYHVRMRNTSKLHHGPFAGTASQSRSWWVLCALWPWPFRSLLECLHPPLWHSHSALPECWCSKACFYSTFLLKLKKKVTDERRPGGSRCWFTIFILL